MLLLRRVGLLSGGTSLSPLRVKASTHQCGGRGCCPSSVPTLACMDLGTSFPLPSLWIILESATLADLGRGPSGKASQHPWGQSMHARDEAGVWVQEQSESRCPRAAPGGPRVFRGLPPPYEDLVHRVGSPVVQFLCTVKALVLCLGVY